MVPCAPHGRQAAFVSDACGHADRRSRLVALGRRDCRSAAGHLSPSVESACSHPRGGSRSRFWLRRRDRSVRRAQARRLTPLFLAGARRLSWLPAICPRISRLDGPRWASGCGSPSFWPIAVPFVRAGAPVGVGAPATDPKRAPVLAAVAAAALYLAAAWAVSPQLPAGDEPHYLVITQSLLLDHDLKIENNHRRGDYHAYYGGDLRPDYLKRGTDDEIYSIHAPGLSVAVIPAFALFGYPGVIVFLALLSAAATGRRVGRGVEDDRRCRS